ncbi:MAG: RidA family protein [Cyclobacteriaceae bacterium]|nr:RidA family protein [Cyclobacteriaceae bacterium]
MRVNYSSGAKWEDIVGYSRAVKIGNTLEISGTVATEGSEVVAKGDFYGQTKYILEKIEKVLKQAGFELKDVVRTRIYVTDIGFWDVVGKAHGEFFSTIKPVTSLIEVSGLIDQDYLVEIEITAVKEN